MEETNQNQINSLFIKIPNGIIELSNTVNSYTCLTYLFLAINKNMLGKVNSSVLFLEECYIDDSMENQKTKASKISKILSCLYLLSNTIVNDKKEIICDSIIDIPKYGDYFNHCEFQVEKAIELIEKEKQKLLTKYQKFPQYMLSIKVDNDDINGKFTILTIEDYLTIMSYCLKENHKEKLKIDSLLNTYLLIKMKVNRNQALNKAFPHGWENKEYIALTKLEQISSLSSVTLRKYLNALLEMNFIEKCTVKKKVVFRLK